MNRTHVVERDDATGLTTLVDSSDQTDRFGRLPLAVMAAATLATTTAPIAARNAPAGERSRFLIRDQADARTYLSTDTEASIATGIAPATFTETYSLRPEVTSGTFLGLGGPWLGGIDLSAAQVLGLGASPWADLLSDVGRWLFLPDGWDGSDSVAPSQSAITEARAFASILRDRGVPVPQHFVSADGEISFDWRKGAARASIAFTTDGATLAYLRKGEGQPIKPYETVVGEPYDWTDFLDGLSVFA